jgi:membrane protease YdiL (CAAX protease family)
MQQSLSSRARILSLVEFVLGGFIVIGHNVLHILPNEVPILFVLGWISLRLRDGGWKAAGLTRPNSLWKAVALAVGAATALQLGSELVVGPLGHRIWPAPQHISHVVGSAALGWRQALTTLLIVWTFAAFGEELSYRGYLLTRAADIFGRSDAAYILAMILVALLFGFGHYYKGPVGVLDSTYSGLVLGCAYLLSGRNLWAAILAHGISDTFALLVVFMGWAN